MVLDTTAQRARALGVLRAAAVFYRARKGTLAHCVVLGAGDEILDAEYARRVLRGVLWEQDLVGWESHPARRRSEVWRTLNTAIRWCSRRAGGWRVGGRERPAIAKVPSTRQWLEWL
jgi:hypothetical protein